MRFGVTMFATDTSMDARRLWPWPPRNVVSTPYGSPSTPTSRCPRRTPPPTGDDGAGRGVQALGRPAGGAGRRGSAHLEDPPGHRDPAARPTRTDRDRQGHRHPGRTSRAARFELGIGFGWNVDEMEQHGVAYRRPRAVTREHVLAMQELWDDEEAEFHGAHVAHRALRGRGPSPRLRYPCSSVAVPDRRCSTTSSSTRTAGSPSAAPAWPESIPATDEALVEAGRDPAAAARIVPFGSHPSPEKLDHFENIGVTECVFRLPSAPADELLPVLDQQAELISSST